MTNLTAQQCSLKTENPSDADNEAGVVNALKRESDMAGFTELRRSEHSTLEKDATRAGYTLVAPIGSDVAVAVKAAYKVTGTHHTVPVPNRALLAVTFEVGDETVTYIETHLHIPEHVRPEVFEAQVDALIAEVQTFGKGDHLVFFGSDTNTDMAHNNPLREKLANAGLILAQVELEEFTPTHAGGKDGSVMDVVGSYNADKRVKAVKVDVQRKSPGLDHRAVVAEFEVAPKRKHEHPRGK